MNKMLTIMERQPLHYYAFFKEPWIPGNIVVKFRRIWEPRYKVLVGIIEHGGSLEWRVFFLMSKRF